MVTVVVSSDLLTYLSVIPDPRFDRNKKHGLSEMLFVASCAVISGAEGWSGIVEFAESKLDWLHRFVKLDNGTPIDDTFARVLSRISPQALHTCFLCWTQALNVNSDALIIGPLTARRCDARTTAVRAIHRCTWCARGPARQASRLGKWSPRPNLTKSRQYLRYCTNWNSKGQW